MSAVREAGFELGGEFYPVTVNLDNGKDLMLIDRVTGMQILDFRDAIQDGLSLGRGSIQLAVLATSIRAKHPTWSVERIYALVTGDLASLEWLGGDEEDAAEGPLAPSAPETTEPTGRSSSSSSDASSSSPTPTVRAVSEESFGTPV